ncbi:GntR family transcriptional regulator [Coraliomargarita parva]|uniref:GntR family transcriptional regulator n=1 Tax=Coraliomargarita parva TaxID=3014050 RepID=UPI0022B5C102|nr:GntR family transcriptional regulator [Coraliomargarita parva]
MEQFEEIKLQRGEVAHRIIADKIREKILSGELAPGTEFPATAYLAERWNTSNSTAHIALKNLVKEGLLERRHGSGTFVRERPRALTNIGVYYWTSRIWSDSQMAFYRSIQGLLERELTQRGYEVSMFVDRRPELAQREAFPALVAAIQKDEIQGLIVPMANAINLPALQKLSIATAFNTSAKEVFNKASFSSKNIFKEPLEYLKEQGCQSVAVISPVHTDRAHERVPSNMIYFKEDFLKEVKAHSLTTKESWIRLPNDYQRNQTLYGYQTMHKMNDDGPLPDAIICYPDMAVRGVITAALELGLHKSERPQFFFHRNEGVELFCPFKASWMITNTSAAVSALIDLVEAQYRGDETKPAHIAFEYEYSTITLPKA